MERTKIIVDDYLKVIQDQISELIRSFNENNLNKYEEDIDILKNIFLDFSGNPIILYPLINSLYQMVYKAYLDDPYSSLKSLFLAITGHYIGEIFEYFGDLKSAIHAYAYSFFFYDMQAITKLLTIQILQLLSNEFKMAAETNKIISSIPQEIVFVQDTFTLQKKPISTTDALEILEYAISMSNYLTYWALMRIKEDEKEYIKKKIKYILKNLIIKGVKTYNLVKNLNDLFGCDF